MAALVLVLGVLGILVQFEKRHVNLEEGGNYLALYNNKWTK